jgi:hypothetical protein
LGDFFYGMPIPKLQIGQHRSPILLAPTGASLQPFSGQVLFSSWLHHHLTTEMQKLRGRIYFDDGAISQSDLKSGGRHVSELDSASWHLLTLGATGSVLGCTRFRQYPNTISWEDLSVSRAPLATCSTWGQAFRASVDAELESAREAGFSYLEIGGWALAPELRRTVEALKSVLAIFALGSLQGGAMGISTATERNGSSSILRRLGGRSLESDGSALPSYYDVNYGCDMEILRFDSRYPSPRYADHVRHLRSQMTQVTVVCPGKNGGWKDAARNFVPAFAGMMQPAIAQA